MTILSGMNQLKGCNHVLTVDDINLNFNKKIDVITLLWELVVKKFLEKVEKSERTINCVNYLCLGWVGPGPSNVSREPVMGVCWSGPGAPLVTRPECVTVLSGAPGWENSWGGTGHRHRAAGAGVGFCVLCMSLVINSSGKLITMNIEHFMMYQFFVLTVRGWVFNIQCQLGLLN